MVKKFKRNGKIAVLYSYQFSGNWSSGNKKFKDECLFDSDIVKLVLNWRKEEKSVPVPNDFGYKCLHPELTRVFDQIEERYVSQIQKIAKEKWGEDFDSHGAHWLNIKWVKEGKQFRIEETDGMERVIIYNETDWETA
jgi:hypothetical protein